MAAVVLPTPRAVHRALQVTGCTVGSRPFAAAVSIGDWLLTLGYTASAVHFGENRRGDVSYINPGGRQLVPLYVGAFRGSEDRCWESLRAAVAVWTLYGHWHAAAVVWWLVVAGFRHLDMPEGDQVFDDEDLPDPGL
jgi:hypothetical protein